MQRYPEFLDRELHRHPCASLLEAKEQEVEARRAALRHRLTRTVLGIPERVGAPRWVGVDEVASGAFRRQKLLIECEPGSWQTALLYLPAQRKAAPLPGVLLASGHGGSKSHGYNQLAAQLYAQLGCAVLLGDPLGEEERHESGGLGVRGHRHDYVIDRMNEAGRPFLGKVVGDLLVGLDVLRHHPEVDGQRLGCAGSSLGGTLVQWLVAVAPGLRAAVLSSWAADDRCLDGTVGCCYRLPGLLREAGQLEMMALGAPECALLVCAGERDEITPPHGLRKIGARLTRWWEQRGAAERFRCEIEAGGGHRPYHLTPNALAWVATHLGIENAPEHPMEATSTLGDIYHAAGRAIEPLYDLERHHRGTRIPAWPLVLEPPEALRILDDAVLRSAKLERSHFTLAGYLEAQRIPPLHPLPALPAGLSADSRAAGKRVGKALERLSSTPAWAKAPLPPESSRCAPGRRGWVPLGFAQAMLRVSRGAGSCPEGTLLLARGQSEPIASGDGVCATVDLVAFNDHETSLGCPSLFINLHLVRRAVAVLRHDYPDILHWRLESWVPRLGELVFFCEPLLESLHIRARQAVEPASAGIGRAENSVPGCAGHLHWVDLLLAAAPRSIVLHRDYLSPEAARLLGPGCVSYLP